MRVEKKTEDEARLSIGALAKATGIPVETLRTWEHRYGYPVPERKPSGHRLYALSSVARLRRISQALHAGHRPAQVVGASDDELDALLGATAPRTEEPQLDLARPTNGDDLVQLIERFDADRLTRVLYADWSRMDPLTYLEQRIGASLVQVGEAWASGRLEVRHEHFFAERAGDVLRSIRIRLEEQSDGPTAVLATLPKEGHELGLMMASVVLAAARWRTIYLGPETPIPDVVETATAVRARAVGLSASVSTKGAATSAGVRKLRADLPKRIELVVGGAGAPKAAPGVVVVKDLHELDRWARSRGRE